MDSLGHFLERFSSQKLVILGDLVVDAYIRGTVHRISREAPVLIVREQQREECLGGAANVVANLCALGGEPVPVGVVGNDREGSRLLELMAERQVPCGSILVDSARRTATKTRVLAGGSNTVLQQVLRIDRENDHPVDPALLASLVLHLRRALQGASALLVSDYGEGLLEGVLLEELQKILREKPLPVFIDSRYRIQRFEGAETLTPNEPELAAATGLDLEDPARLEAAGKQILAATRSRSVLVKRGRNGMALFAPDGSVERVPAYGLVDMADVTGAGDTVLAAFSLARVAGASLAEAMRIANVAGGIKVTKRGTAVVHRDELRRALEGLS